MTYDPTRGMSNDDKSKLAELIESYRDDVSRILGVTIYHEQLIELYHRTMEYDKQATILGDSGLTEDCDRIYLNRSTLDVWQVAIEQDIFSAIVDGLGGPSDE